jgi:hypothetical protein
MSSRYCPPPPDQTSIDVAQLTGAHRLSATLWGSLVGRTGSCVQATCRRARKASVFFGGPVAARCSGRRLRATGGRAAMAGKKMNTGMAVASTDGGQSEFGFVLSVDDFVKLAKDAGCKQSAIEGQGLEDKAPTNAKGLVTFEDLFRFCKENGKIDECPSGASFKAQAWQDFQAWWGMRLVFMESDKDMSGTLSMHEVRALVRPARAPSAHAARSTTAKIAPGWCSNHIGGVRDRWTNCTITTQT